MYFEILDLEKGMYPEVRQVITRLADNANQCIVDAMEIVRSYLNNRYDMSAEYVKEGELRNGMVVKLVKDIAIYNCYLIANPSQMTETRTQVYKDAIAFLKDIRAGKANIDNLPLLSDTDPTIPGVVTYGGNTKRKNLL